VRLDFVVLLWPFAQHTRVHPFQRPSSHETEEYGNCF
jgi:hypothetical protein